MARYKLIFSKTILLVVGVIALTSTLACTQKSKESKVTITFPNLPISTSRSISQNVGALTLPDPTSLNDFDCFAVFVGADEKGLNERYCPVAPTNAVFRFGPARGLVPRGGSISIDIPSGPKRSVYIVGFAASGSCEHFTELDAELNDANYSDPFFLGSATQDLVPGPQKMTINVAFDATKRIGDCRFNNNSDGGGGGGGAGAFGNGADGNQIFAFTSPRDLTTLTYTDPSLNVRTFTAIQRVTGISASGTNYNLALAAPPNGQQFQTGDDVLLYFAAASNMGCGNPADAPNSLHPGFKVGGTVTSFTANTSAIQVSLQDPRVSNIASANLAAAATNASTFCRAVLVRVPNFNDLTVDFQNPVAAYVPEFGSMSGSNHLGGILAFKVRNILTTTAFQGEFNVSGRGFSSGVSGKPGESTSGYATSAGNSPNGQGGGGGVSPGDTPGGGGHGGNGAAGSPGSEGYSIGDSFGCSATADPQQRCLFGKMFFGGAGGTHNLSSTANSSAGGIILVSANRILVPDNTSLSFKSNGVSTLANDGGGAGGSILIKSHEMSVSGPGGKIYAETIGANSTNSGGGAGGRIHFDISTNCNLHSSASLELLATAGSGGTVLAQDGTKHFTGGALAQTATCLLPSP